MGTVTVFTCEVELSLTVTEVPTDAILTPVILIVATRLSPFKSCAVAIAVGAVAIAYGGVPPLMETFADVPTPTPINGGFAASDWPDGNEDVGGDASLLHPVGIKPPPITIIKITNER